MENLSIKSPFKWFFLSLIEFLLIFVLPLVLVWWYLRNDIQNLVLAFVMIVQLYILAFQAELSLRNEALTKLSYLPVFRVVAKKGVSIYNKDEDKVDSILSIGDNPYGGLVLKNVGKFPAFNVVVVTNIDSEDFKDAKTETIDVIPSDAERIIYKFPSGLDPQIFKKTRIDVTATYTSFTDDTKTVSFIKPKDSESFITFQSNKMPSFLLGVIEKLSMSAKWVLYRLKRENMISRSASYHEMSEGGGRNLEGGGITKICRYVGQAIFIFGKAINLIANSALMIVIIFFIYTLLRGAGANGKEAANTVLNIISGNELVLAVVYITIATVITSLMVSIEDGKRWVENKLNEIIGAIAFFSFAITGWLSAGSKVGKLFVIIWVISFVAIGWYAENKKMKSREFE